MGLEDLLQELEDVQMQDFADNRGLRLKLIKAAQDMVLRLEDPWARMSRLIWAQVSFNTDRGFWSPRYSRKDAKLCTKPPILAGLQIALDLSLFQQMLTLGPEGITAEDMAKVTTNATSEFLTRLLHLLCTADFLKMTGEDAFGLTSCGEAIARDVALQNAVRYAYDGLLPVANNGPEFFREHGYESPRAGRLWRHATSTDMPFYQWLAAKPEKAATFNSVMQGYSSTRPMWISVYAPVDELLHDTPAGCSVLVDVGGGSGQDAIRFMSTKKELIRGPVVLQDLPDVIRMADEHVRSNGITPMAHNFFDPQPIKGARFYFIRNALLNWSDEEVVKILTNMRQAMEPGFSRLLINELILGADPMSAPLDYAMMGIFSGSVRTEGQWRRIILNAGLKMVKLWTSFESREAIVEAVL